MVKLETAEGEIKEVKDITKYFLEGYGRKNTRDNYATTIQQFFKFLNLEGNEINQYFDSSRNYKKDISTFLKSKTDLAKKSYLLKLSTMRMFLDKYGIRFSKDLWKTYIKYHSTEGNLPTTDMKTPTTQELHDILVSAPIKHKTLFMCIATSGMRIGEATQIKLDDLYLKEYPPRIHIQAEYTKRHQPRDAWISEEAKDCLLEWLYEKNEEGLTPRERALEVAYQKTLVSLKKSKNRLDNRVFPYSAQTGRHMFYTLTSKITGMGERDKNTRIKKLSPKSLRSFFSTKMRYNVKEVFVESMLGHSSYLAEAYKRYTKEEIAQEYLKGGGDLIILERKSISQEINGFKNDLANKDKEIEKLKQDYKDGLEIMKEHFRETYMEDTVIIDEDGELIEAPESLRKYIKKLKEENKD
ncbi:MAG: site-specific integrase [Thermoplasmatales archaeon]|nr:site-specific integrase [Thermoplasmatales archaeon]